MGGKSPINDSNKGYLGCSRKYSTNLNRLRFHSFNLQNPWFEFGRGLSPATSKFNAFMNNFTVEQ